LISDHTLLRLLRSNRRVLLYGDLFRAALLFVLLMVLALWTLYYAAIVRFMFTELHMNDFGKFYFSARLFLDGEDMYGPSPATELPVGEDEIGRFWNLNPPHFHLILLPLARLAPGPALAAWAAINLVALVACLWLITRELALRWTIAGAGWLVVGMVLSAASGTILLTGQLTFLLALPVTAAWIHARRGAWHAAALLLGIAASVKPFLGIFALYLLATRRLGSLARMIVAIAACVLAGLSVFGTSAYASWLGALSSVQWPWAPMNASLAGLLSRSFGANPFHVPVVDAPWLIAPASILLSVLIGVVSIWMVARDQSPDATDRVFFGLLIAAQLASPLGWIYYLWLPAGAAFALWRSRRARPSAQRDWLVVLATPGLMCPLPFTLMASDGRWMGLTLGSAYAWSVLILWFAFVADWFARDRGRA